MIKSLILCLSLIPAVVYSADNAIQLIDTNPKLPEYSEVANIDWRTAFQQRSAFYKPLSTASADIYSNVQTITTSTDTYNNALRTVAENQDFLTPSDKQALQQQQQIAQHVIPPSMLMDKWTIPLLACVACLPVITTKTNFLDYIITTAPMLVLLFVLLKNRKKHNRRNAMLNLTLD